MIPIHEIFTLIMAIYILYDIFFLHLYPELKYGSNGYFNFIESSEEGQQKAILLCESLHEKFPKSRFFINGKRVHFPEAIR